MKGHFSDKQIKTALRKYFKQIVIEPVEKGVSSYTYRLDTEDGIFFLTISKNKQESLQSRFSGLKLLVEAGAKVTKPLAYEDFSPELEGHSFLITHLVQGKEIQNRQGNLEEILRVAGKNLALTHQIKLQRFGYTTQVDSVGKPTGTLNSYYKYIAETVRYKDSLANKVSVLEEHEVISSNLAAAVFDHVSNNKELLQIKQGVMIHGDFSTEHIFANKTKFTGIIDWDGMASGSPFYDLAQFSTYHEDKWPHLLDGYLEVAGDIKDFEERLLVERVVYCIGKTAKAYKFNKPVVQGYSQQAKQKLLEDLEKLK